MSKFSKTLCVICGLLLIIFFSLTALEFSTDVALPSEFRKYFSQIGESDFARKIYSSYIFWMALVLCFLTFILILVIIFYRRTYTEIKLADEHLGILLLKKSAVEGYVKTIIHESDYMKSPSVKVTLYRKKIKVIVVGKILPRVAVLEKTSQVSQDIQQGFNDFFGISKKVNFKVKVENIEEKKNVASSRVE